MRSLLPILLLATPLTAATIPVATTDDLRRALQSAKPGDEILLTADNYTGNTRAANLHGAPDKPITIRGKPTTTITGGDTSLQLSKCSHLQIRDLILDGATGNGLNIDDGGTIDKPSHHITLKNLTIKNVGPKGNCDALKLSGVDNFTVDNCTFEKWGDRGSGIDMVGCHDGVITNSNFKDGGDNAIQTKGASANITIQQCRFTNAGERAINIGGSTGKPFFRPSIENKKDVYEAKNITVQGCTFIEGQAHIAFVGVDGATVRFNTLYLPEKWAIRILQESRGPEFIACRNGKFEDNIILFRTNRWAEGGVNIGPGTAPDTFKFARNLWYCEDRPNRSTPKLPTPEENPITTENPHLILPTFEPDSPNAISKGATAFKPPNQK